MNLTDLDTFLRVVNRGSYTAAASEMGIPKSTVSRRVARLEDQLGVQLLARKSRSISVTPFGRQLHARAAPAIQEIHEVERSLEDATGEPAGTLRLTSTNDIGTSPGFARLLTSYCERHPKVRLEVELTSRKINLIDEGYDVAFRAHAGPLRDADGLMAKKMIASVGFCFASPGYLARAPKLEEPEDLVEHKCLSLNVSQLRDAWPLSRGEETRTIEVGVRALANDFALLGSMALADGGVAFLPSFFARPYVDRGELVPVLPGWVSPGGNFTLVWPASRYLAARVRAFIDVATEFFQSREDPFD